MHRDAVLHRPLHREDLTTVRRGERVTGEWSVAYDEHAFRKARDLRYGVADPVDDECSRHPGQRLAFGFAVGVRVIPE